MTSPATDTRLLHFWVNGIPKPQGSKRAFQHPSTRRIVMTESAGAALKDWRYDVKATAAIQMAGRPLVSQPQGVHLSVHFVMPRPTSLPKTKATPACVKKPDLDKLIRAVCDSLKGVVYADDSQVISMSLQKRTAEIGEATGAQITVYTTD